MRKAELMRSLFGQYDAKCKDCIHLKGGVNEYRKCKLYGNSASEATDWALSWRACGMFNKPVKDGFVPIFQRKKRGFYSVYEEPVQCEGQISLFEEQ